MPTNSALIADRLETLSLKVDGLAGRIKLRPMVRVALGVALVLSIGGNVWNWQEHRQQVHDQCVSGNHGRAEIKQAFGTLYDEFVAATHGNAAAVDFKKQGMGKIEKGLPQRPC